MHKISDIPLSGRTVLVTRTTEGNVIEKQRLEKLGASVLELPTIEILAPSSFEGLDRAIEEISYFDWVVFTSANGVRAFFKRVRDTKQERRVFDEIKVKRKIKFACVGPSTEKALESEIAQKASFVPTKFLTERLGEELSVRFSLDGRKILLARVENAAGGISETLRRGGAKVIEVSTYKTLPRRTNTDESRNLLDGVTDITFTSPSTVEGFLASIKPEDLEARKAYVHCIGPVTAKRAIDRGLTVSSVAKVHTIDGLLHSMVEFLNKLRKEIAC